MKKNEVEPQKAAFLSEDGIGFFLQSTYEEFGPWEPSLFAQIFFPGMENGVKVKKVLDDMQARDLPRQSIHNHPRKKCSEEIPARFSTTLEKKSIFSSSTAKESVKIETLFLPGSVPSSSQFEMWECVAYATGKKPGKNVHNRGPTERTYH